MASTSRIPVSARISASSSMPAITTTSASPSRSLTHHLAAQDTVNKMADSDSDDHAWGKIERLRIRRIYSEGSSDFAGSSHPSSGTSTDNSPFLGAVTVKLAQERRKTYKSTHDVTGPNTDTATARAGHEDVARPGVATNRISSERPTQIAIPPRDPKNDIAIGPSSPNQRHQTIKNPPVSTRITSLSLMPPLHHSGLNRSSPVDSNHLESVYSKGETESKSQTQKEFANVRPKLVSTLSQGERDMHALGFRAVTNTDAIPGHMAADTRWQGVDAANNRKASVATVDTVSSTGADGGVPNRLRHLLGTESDREFAKTRAKGNISPDEFDVRAAPRRKAIDIPTFLPSSHDMVTFAPINTPARTAAYVDEVASNPPNLPIMLDTDPSESDNSLHAPATTVTTAEKRHQPNLRLSPMPNAPVLLGPPFRHSSRSPVPGVSPPIPAKNPLRQRSSFGGGASGSRASTPGLSGIPSPNSLYATPSDTPGPGILDSAMFLPSRQSQQPTMVAASPEPKPSAQTPTIANKNRENSGRSPKRPEKPPNAKDRRMHCDKAPTTAEIMKAIEFAEGPLQKQRSNTSNISVSAKNE
ncbi:hypothetical protein QFC19_002985 [Naganishia cerealis]|uniref:Uncharacterized protein n=1 Tax=Naganishia cerealis TaxID=610337 RepID=A0ACC2W7M6_9TREE|nr:hypothetical protein QFC19_002985 [Naganishia cerealis]